MRKLSLTLCWILLTWISSTVLSRIWVEIKWWIAVWDILRLLQQLWYALCLLSLVMNGLIWLLVRVQTVVFFGKISANLEVEVVWEGSFGQILIRVRINSTMIIFYLRSHFLFKALLECLEKSLFHAIIAVFLLYSIITCIWKTLMIVYFDQFVEIFKEIIAVRVCCGDRCKFMCRRCLL